MAILTQPATGAASQGHDPSVSISPLDEAATLVRQLSGSASEAQAALPRAKALVQTLRDERDFAAMGRLAEAVSRVDPADARNRRLYAQCLIDTGQASVALDVLQRLRERLDPADPEAAEVAGLQGRAHKQIHFDATDRSSPTAQAALAAAIEAYRAPYEADPSRHTWHGVNLLALLSRARRLGRDDLAPELDPADVALELVSALRAIPEDRRDVWYQPTLAEATLGLSLGTGDLRKVEAQLRAYVTAPGVQAFQLASTLRQFCEVWGLEDLAGDGKGTGLAGPEAVARARALVDILRARLLQLPGGSLELPVRPGPVAAAETSTSTSPSTSAPEAAPVEAVPAAAQLEAVLGPEGPKTYAWWRAGVDAARSVGAVRQRLGQRLGTCFLVRAVDFGLQPADELLVLTNFHVVNPAGEGDALEPEMAEVVFEAADPGRVYPVAEVLWCSPVDTHDACLLRLAEPVTGIAPLPLSTTLPPRPAVWSEEAWRMTRARRTEPNAPATVATPADPAAAAAAASPPPPAARVYIIGHPAGRELSISFQDNELLDHEGEPGGQPSKPGVCKLHYCTPTEPGNSGSPVFDDRNWRVVALHHAGGQRGLRRLNGIGGTDGANEGLGMAALLQAARSELATAPAG
jgi:hypothetical protein